MKSRRPLLALFAVLVCGWGLAACSEPDGVELFVRRSAARDGVYIYRLPLTDTTAAYDFWFYSRSQKHSLADVQLNVQWLAPSGNGFSETVYMRRVDVLGSRELYRSGMVPAEAGEWQLSVRPVGTGEELLGFGVVCKRQDGTR